MILQALTEYYVRKAKDFPPYGLVDKAIPFVVVLNPDGSVAALESTSTGKGKSRRTQVFRVPRAVIRTGNINPNLLWDNLEYALELSKTIKTIKSAEKVVRRHTSFIQRLNDFNVEDEGVKAVRLFLARKDKIALLQAFDEDWKALTKKAVNLSFRLAGDTCLVAERPAVYKAIRQEADSLKGPTITCSVTGNRDVLARVHDSIKGVNNSRDEGAKLVSFNLESCTSFGKEQGENASVGDRAAFYYTIALNSLLARGLERQLLIGDASTVSWASCDTRFEEALPKLLKQPPKDDPDRAVDAVADLRNSVYTGAYEESDKETRFYVLGLAAPEPARLTVRFWYAGTVPELAARLAQHFEDTRVDHFSNEKDVLSLFRLLVSLAPQGDSKNIPAKLSSDIMRAILAGEPYPREMMQAVIRRVRADHKVTYPRIALLKAGFNRSVRFANPKQQKELHVSLDTDNVNIGYRLGRLFATLEKIQVDARFGAVSAVHNKLCSLASSTPAAIFPKLLRLKQNHKPKGKGRQVFFEIVLGEIMSGIAGFPKHLGLADQAHFFTGYYHQRQKFYTKKSEQPDQEQKPNQKEEPNNE